MAPDDRDSRPDPDALILAAAREGKGKLKIFLGAAPGVGKTWEMLTAARHRKDEGLDVVVGLVETHGRAETQAQIGTLPVLPRKPVSYRGQMLQEFDLDAALARRPALLLVDELAHTNAPGSRHHKRWEDVAELLESGIDVWATMNVQHLESLNESIARITGVRVSETVPDRILDIADEIKLIDLPPADLRARLTEGKIYPAETARRALGGFFREGNLAALREIALRRAADHVDADVTDYMRANAIPGPWPAAERVLALVGTNSTGEAVVRHARRLADALHAPLIVLHVERLGSTLNARVPLLLAAQLGAEVETVAGTDVVATTLEVARKRNVSQIVMGRDVGSPWWRLPRRSVAQKMVRRGSAFALHVVPVAADAPARPNLLPRLPREWLPWLVSLALVAAVTLMGAALRGLLDHEALGMVFLAAVVAASSLYGLVVGLSAALLGFLAWNYFFIPPLYALTIDSPRDVIAVLVFLGVAGVTGALAGRVSAESQVAQARIEGLRVIGSFSRRLGEPTTEPDLLDEIARQAAGIADAAVVLTQQAEDLNIRAAEPAADTLDDAGWAAARWALTRGEQTGNATATLPSSAWRFMPLRTVRGMIGVLGVRTGKAFDAPLLQVLGALADQAAVAIERVRLATSAARSAAHSETQRLRTALLSSLSHDLRTPLAGILGAAGTLRAAWDTLDRVTREDLLGSIEQDTERMTRFLANIMEMTRLESGEIIPRSRRIDLGEVIEAAIGRVPGALHVSVDMPPPSPQVAADPALLEQVLVNVLDNAVKYSPAGSPISVTVGVWNGNVTIRVADFGAGISAGDLPHVFDSFYRASHGDRVAPGTGLGLAIARGLLEAMGGAIEASSPRPDAARDGMPGTVITLRLPEAR
jgi:two-component system sensor histidine kinase KdpD